MNFLKLLEQIGRAPVRGARAINDAMYDEDPILRERKERIDLGPGLGESDVPTGDMETVGFGPKRPSKLNRVLGEAARGAIVAARNPTRGQIGTAGDIFGAMGAVEDDTRARSDRQMALNRQAEKDAMDRRLNESRARENEAQADYAQWRTTQAKTGRTAAPSRIEVYQQAYKHGIDQGMDEDSAQRWATEIALGQRDPYNANSRDPKQNLARLEDMYSRGEISTVDYEDRKARILGTVKASAQNTAEGTRVGKGVPMLKGKNILTDKGGKNYFPPMFDPNTGKTYGGTVQDEVLYQPPVKKPVPMRPRPETPAQSRTAELKSILNKSFQGDWQKTLQYIKTSDDPQVASRRAELVAEVEANAKRGAVKKGLNVAGDAAALGKQDPDLKAYIEWRKGKGFPAVSDAQAAEELKAAKAKRVTK